MKPLLTILLLLCAGVADAQNVILDSTVRICVDESDGHSYGTGTIIDSRDGEAIVITCGHLFRESGGKGLVRVDLFASDASGLRMAGTKTGQLISYDCDAEIGLVSFRPDGPVTVARVAGTDSASRGDTVYASGCNEGSGFPSIQSTRVTAINRYQGPSNIQIDGAPVEGRSGGGLFSESGELIGVCFAADYEGDEGIFAALGTIHTELDSHGLADVYKSPRAPKMIVETTATDQPDRNFGVYGSTHKQCVEFANCASYWRDRHAKEWFGQEFPDWPKPCVVKVRCNPLVGGGGATYFTFDRGEVFDFKGTWQGSREELLRNVIPHEVLHTVFASYFRQPLPRWADEGACSAIEDQESRDRLHGQMVNSLQSGRGYPFTAMMLMSDYPADTQRTLEFYGQAKSVAAWIIDKWGRKVFLEFVGDNIEAMNANSSQALDVAINKHFGYRSAQAMQADWMVWVRDGSPLEYEVGYGPDCPSCVRPQRYPAPQQYRIVAPTPKPRPPQRPTVQQPPAQPGENRCLQEIATLKAELAKMQAEFDAKITNLAMLPGQRGPKGDKGDRGLTGEAGQSPTLDINALAAAVSQNLNYQEIAGGIQPFLDSFSIRAYRDDPYQTVHPGNKVDLNLERQ